LSQGNYCWYITRNVNIYVINKRLSNIDGITSEKFSNLGSRFEYVLN